MISAADELGRGGAKRKFKDNVAAIRLLKQLRAEDRFATSAEQSLLVRYVGWGGLAQAFDSRNTEWANEYRELADLLPSSEYDAARRSTQDAHYTAETVIRGMYRGVERLGFTGGRALEPAAGIGHFVGLQPSHLRASTTTTAIELDPTTAAIARALYPNTTIINRGFQDVAIPAGMFDLVIGNPPFGNQKVFDTRHKDLSDFSIHNYFIAKSIDAVRPGGVVAVVVSNFFLDAKVSEAREHIAERANLIGAIRLPNNAFKQNALTEVTTDIVFLQRLGPEQTPDRSWVEVASIEDQATGAEIPLNRYYIDRPEMMLGRMSLEGSMYAGGTPALIAAEGESLESALNRAIEALPKGIFHAEIAAAAAVKPDVDSEEFEVPQDVKIGAFFLSPRGRIAVREDDLLDRPQYRWADLKNEKAGDRIKGMIEIRHALRSLMAAERSERSGEEAITSRREHLNRVYDRFVKRNGYVSSQANKQAFVEDPDYALLHSLEREYDRGISKEVARKNHVEPREPNAKKAEIFTQRVMTPYREITKVETAKDALVVSMNETGKVDMDLMVRLSGIAEEDIVRDLYRLIYPTPDGTWETADRYLSGNVKHKLAKALEVQGVDHRFQANVEALKAVLPADIEPVDISIQLGSSWVPEAVVSDFVTHLFGEVRRNIAYAPSLGKWVASISPSSDRTAMRATWGTEDIPGNELMASILTGKPIQVKEVIGRNPTTGQVETRINEERTTAASQKADEIRQAFSDWVWEDRTRREMLGRIYNDRFNTNVPPRYDGSHLVLPGSSQAITLRPHQKDAIWRGIQDGTALFDHVVGAGKTMVVIGTVMESKRMGLIKKPMIVVPNHLLMQWKDAFYELYPGANVLIAEKHEFKKESRERLFAKIATGNWDAVVVAHSSFKKIGMPEATLEVILNEQITDLTDSIVKLKSDSGDRLTIKEMEKARDRMKAKLERQADTGTKDRVVDFAELGVDALAIDELHEFKNLFINTTKTRVSGLGNLAGSDKAFDLFVKVRYIQQANEGRGMFGATGTPISNTIAEMYTVQRYMHYDEMKERGIVHFDAWASTFGQVVTGWELDATGVNYRLNDRFAKFQNVPELINMYRTFADTITATDLQAQAAALGMRFPVPKISGGKPQNIIVERTSLQANYMGIQTPLMRDGAEVRREDGSVITDWNPGSIIFRMENLPDDPRIDNPLKVTNDARKAGLDFRLVDPDATDVPNTKVNEAIDRIVTKWAQWDELAGTQLVFCDLSTPKAKRSAVEFSAPVDDNDDGLEAPDEEQAVSMDELLSSAGKFSVYDDMRAKLIERGIPEDQIAFIHDYNTDARKQKLYAEMNAGTKRILFGSTAKMGAGTNVQRRLVALHHLDAPWRPSDLEQREGRILRQGNVFYNADPDGFEVDIYRYSTKQTYDARMWQTIQGKAEGIEQFRRGDSLQRVIEDVASEASNAAEMKAAATGNPLIFQQVQISSDLKKLEAVYSGYKRARHTTESRAEWLSRADQRADGAIETARMEIARRDRNTTEEFQFRVDGAVYGKEDQSVLLGIVMDAMKRALQESTKEKRGERVVGVYRGFDIHVHGHENFLQFQLRGAETHSPANIVYGPKDEFKISGFFTRIDNYLARLNDRVDDAEIARADQTAEYLRAKAELAKPFAQMSKLEILRKDMADVMSELKKGQANPSYVSEWVPLSSADASIQEQALADIQERSATGQADPASLQAGTTSAVEVALAREVAGDSLISNISANMPAVDDATRNRASRAVADYLIGLDHVPQGETILRSRIHEQLWQHSDGDEVHDLVVGRIGVDLRLARAITQYPGSEFATVDMKDAAERALQRFDEVRELADSMGMRVDLADRQAGVYDGQVVGTTDKYVVQKVDAQSLVAHVRKDFASERDVRMSRPIQVKYTHGIALVKQDQNRAILR